MKPSLRRDYLDHLQHFGIKLGLENVATLLGALGDPQRGFPSIHVAGTNGKGSVSAMLESVLRLHGFRTGLYTSPHLVRVEERIRVAGVPVGPGRFGALLGRAKDAIDGLMRTGRLVDHPTYFEVLTALAFLEFAERSVDIAVLEVGMGGRFDATNVVRPLVSVITTISRDHEKHLGRSLRSIAFEKAGIVKDGVPLVCGVKGGTARREIHRVAGDRRAPVIDVFGRGRHFEVRTKRGGYSFRYETPEGRYDFSPALAGRHQGENAAVAIAAAETLGRVWRPVDRTAIIRGISEARWEGRLETVRRRPPVVLDGAHNEEGARSLADFVRENLRTPVVLVFGVMKDKNIGAMARILFPLARRIVLTRVPYKRSAEPAEVLASAPEFADRIRLEPDTGAAVRMALAEANARTPVVVAGSLFLVGEVKRLQLF